MEYSNGRVPCQNSNVVEEHSRKLPRYPRRGCYLRILTSETLRSSRRPTPLFVLRASFVVSFPPPRVFPPSRGKREEEEEAIDRNCIPMDRWGREHRMQMQTKIFPFYKTSTRSLMNIEGDQMPRGEFWSWYLDRVFGIMIDREFIRRGKNCSNGGWNGIRIMREGEDVRYFSSKITLLPALDSFIVTSIFQVEKV